MRLITTKIGLFFLLVLVLTIPSFFKIVRPGFFPMQDDMQVFRVSQLDKCIQDSQIPCRWIPDAGYQYGYPQFNFYAPFIYYLAEGFHLTGLQFIDSTKIIIILGFLLSAITMFMLAREFFGEWPALVASTLYTYAPYKAQQIYVRGALSEFWASVFFPLILWSIYKLIKSGDKKYIVWSSLSLAGIFLTHNLFSFLFIPIIVFWTLFWLISEKKNNLSKLFLSVLIGLGIASFFVLPMIFERQYVHTETLLGGYFDYRQHFVSFKQLFLSNTWGYGSSQIGPNDDLALSVGIVHWIVGLLSVGLAFLNFRKNKTISTLIIFLGVIVSITLFLIHEKSSFIWLFASPLAWLQFPWRLLSLIIFILSFLSAYFVSSLGKAKYILGVLVVGGVFLLHGGFFTPKSWLEISDKEKLSGELWEKELTASIFDYLPIYAKMPPEFRAPEIPETLKGEAKFLNYKKGSDYQTGSLEVTSDARVRLPLFDFPGMNVYLDGVKHKHFNDDCSGEKFCTGLISFDVPKGSYNFKVELDNTPVRSIGNVLSVLSFLSLIFVIFKKDEKFSKK